MDDLDRKVGRILAADDTNWSNTISDRIAARLEAEPAPAEILHKRSGRLMGACVAAAVMAGIVTTGLFELQGLQFDSPRWPAAAMDASPSVLLLAERGR